MMEPVQLRVAESLMRLTLVGVTRVSKGRRGSAPSNVGLYPEPIITWEKKQKAREGCDFRSGGRNIFGVFGLQRWAAP